MANFPGEQTPPAFQRVGEQPPTPPEDTPPPPPQRSGGGLGCLVPFFVALLLALVLVGVALLLPPFSLLDRLTGTQYVMLDAQNNAARSPDQALTLVLNPDDPGVEFGVALDSVPQDAFTAGTTDAAWGGAALSALPANLTLTSNVYTVDTTGSAPGTVTLSLAIPEGITNLDLLDAYTWDGSAWRFLPTQPVDACTLITESARVPGPLALFETAPPSAPRVAVPVDVRQTLTDEVAGIATIVTPGGIQPTLDGALTGSLAAGVEMNAGYRLMPAIRNFADPRALDVDTISAIINNRALRETHIQQIASFAGAYNGVFIDYRDLPAEDRAAFTQFIEELAATLNARGLQLGVVVPGAQNASGSWDTGAYDWRALGAVADYVQVNLDRADPAMFAPGEDRLVEAMLRWGVGEVSRYKLLVGLTTRSQLQASGGYTPVGYEEALAPLGNVQITGELTEEGSIIPGAPFTASLDGLRATTGEDETAQTPYIDYLDDNDNPISRVWLTTDEALTFRLSRTRDFAIGGVALPDLALGDLADGVLGALANYKLGTPYEPARTDLYVQWRVESSAGVVAEEIGRASCRERV